MVTFQHIDVTAVSDRPITFQYWSGIGVRTWFVEQTRTADAQLLQSVTNDDHPPPFSVTPVRRAKVPDLRPDTAASDASTVYSYTCAVTTLHSDLTALWDSHILPTIVGNRLEIEGHRLIIESVNTETITDVDLLQAYTLSPTQPPRWLHLRFVTPVTFRVSGAYFPFPSPSLVFGSLLDRWNSVSTLHLHPDTRTFANDCVRVSHYQMQSRMVDTGESAYGRIVGAVGDVTYAIWRGDEYWYRIMHVLAAFSAWAGIGARTAIGLGNGHLVESVSRP